MTKGQNRTLSFGQILYNSRIQKGIGLREICRRVGYDPSNWSKIEREKMPPPSDEKVLKTWADALGIIKNSKERGLFLDSAYIAQGIIPKGLSQEEMLEILPAFFRTIRNKKPTKEELDELMNIIRKSNV